MSRRAPARRESGAAVMEFVVVVMLVAVPLAYAATAVARVHAAAVAAQTGASAAALAVARGVVVPAGAGRVASSYWTGGHEQPDVTVTAGPTVTVTVSAVVDLPLLPSVPVRATAAHVADRYVAP